MKIPLKSITDLSGSQSSEAGPEHTVRSLLVLGQSLAARHGEADVMTGYKYKGTTEVEVGNKRV